MTEWEPNFQVDFNGLSMGGEGSPYRIDTIEGLHDTPEVRTSDTDRPRQHGQTPGRDLHGGRSIRSKITVVTAGADEAIIVGDFSRAMVSGQRSELPLLVTIPGLADGRQVRVMAKVRGQILPVDEDYRSGAGKASVRWWATDPLIYDAALTTLNATQASSAGTGAALPLELPVDLGGAVSGGLLTAINEGEVDAPWTATITGPVNGPRIENVTTGQKLRFTGNLAAGETLVLDSLNKDVLLNGDAARQTWIGFGSEWFDLPPGTTLLRFAGSGGPGSIQVSFRSAWI